MSTTNKKKKFFNKSQDSVKKTYFNARNFFKSDFDESGSTLGGDEYGSFDKSHKNSSSSGKSSTSGLYESSCSSSSGNNTGGNGNGAGGSLNSTRNGTSSSSHHSSSHDPTSSQTSSSTSSSSSYRHHSHTYQSHSSSHHENDEDDYIRLRRVKKAHQCAELGEREEFDGDIKFYLDGLSRVNNINTRCLSILGLANQCQRAEFRMHLRAHDDMPKIISALMDGCSNPNLALCTSALMYVYNQDRMTMDIDPNALSLMLELLETRTDEEEDSVDKNYKEKVKKLCEEMKTKGHGKFLNLNNITAGKLALEALLGLTSKRASEWCKEELRNLKGIDFLCNQIIEESTSLIRDDIVWEEEIVDKGLLHKIERTLKVIENVTFMNQENQNYIIEYQGGKFIRRCIELIKYLKNSIIFITESQSQLSTLLSILRVLTNLTSESSEGCYKVGSFTGLFQLLLECLFELPSFTVPDSRFDLIVLLLCLEINFVEYCVNIREELMDSAFKVKRLIAIFEERCEEAEKTDKEADLLLDSHQDKPLTEAMQDTLLNQVLAQSGKHMEHCIIAACISLLIGCGIKENMQYCDMIKNFLPSQGFEKMIDVLTKLHEFTHLADIMTPSGVRRVERILALFKSTKTTENSSNNSTEEDKDEDPDPDTDS
ncbi:wings apart-like protein homolog [Panonychus citri]|uniref:wings apart-like protein homolog n=1 Tax=Panonychus citri TaxID=50023 RepID=UPI002306E2F0|nr:wings apart-like protein homolog [Panonychus citri]XP_053211370.1 wings apart-like protein homolog [Panonychus citri]